MDWWAPSRPQQPTSIELQCFHSPLEGALMMDENSQKNAWALSLLLMWTAFVGYSNTPKNIYI